MRAPRGDTMDNHSAIVDGRLVEGHVPGIHGAILRLWGLHGRADVHHVCELRGGHPLGLPRYACITPPHTYSTRKTHRRNV